MKINDIDINKYKTHEFINSLEDLCGKIVLVVVPNVEEDLPYDITPNVAGNAHTLHSGIKINGEEFNCNVKQSDKVVLSFLFIPSYVEDEELLSRLRSKT